MTEKDTDSMATVQIKPDYAASEVYSTASEPPPIGLFNFNQQAYKRQSNSVKIAKITAFTVIISSFILGSFILASSYLQAKSSCDQVQALDSVLEKELMLETLQQVNKESPRAEALLGKQHNNDMDLQNINEVEDRHAMRKINSKQQQDSPVRPVENAPSVGEIDSSFSENEETEDLQKVPAKVPFEFDLSDLAAALLQNQHKSRMNCVVERKRAEEIVDSPSKTVALPFGMNLTTDPKKARVTGERISIFCEGGNENKDQPQGRQNNRETEEDDDTEADAEPIRPMFIPYQRIPIPFGPNSNQFPLTHLPQRMMPPMQQPMIHQMPPPFQQLPIRPPMPQQVMQAPHPEPQPQQQTVRIHVPIREIHMANDIPVQIPASHQELPHFQVQRVPLDVALQRAGITPEDLQNIQRMAEDRINDELRRLAVEEVADSSVDSENNNSSEEDTQSQQSSQGSRENEQQQQQQQQQQPQQQQPHMQIQILPQQQMLHDQPSQHLILQKQQLPEQPRDTMVPPMPDQPQHLMQFGRAVYGRSLAQPVRIPVPMMQAQADMSQETNESERPHFVQPRSVRSTELFKSED